MKAFRSRRVGELIRRELSEIFRQYRDEFGGLIITVTEVRIPKDIRTADIWVSIFSDPEVRQAVVGRLTAMSGKLRHLLAGRVYLRRIPELIFKLDETLDNAERIESLLRDSGIQDRTEHETENLNE